MISESILRTNALAVGAEQSVMTLRELARITREIARAFGGDSGDEKNNPAPRGAGLTTKFLLL